MVRIIIIVAVVVNEGDKLKTKCEADACDCRSNCSEIETSVHSDLYLIINLIS